MIKRINLYVGLLLPYGVYNLLYYVYKGIKPLWYLPLQAWAYSCMHQNEILLTFFIPA
jgi:hypothetical protein